MIDATSSSVSVPRISVIMGVFNGARRVARAIDSVIEQSEKDWELIICDDGSTDDTWSVLNGYGKIDPRIRLLRNSANSGLSHSLNRCLALANGLYVARMDDDDISHPDRFRKQLEAFEANPDVDIVGTSRRFFDERGVWGKSETAGVRSPRDIYLGRTFVHPSVMLTRTAYAAAAGYSEGRHAERTEDYDLWCRLYALGYRGLNLGDLLLDYYQSATSYKKRKLRYRVNETRVKLRALKALGIPLQLWPLALKPLLSGMIPAGVMNAYHRRRFGLNDRTGARVRK